MISFFFRLVCNGWMDGWMFFRFFETMMLFYSFFTFLKDFTHFIFFFIPAKPKQTPPIYLLSPILLFSVSVIPSSRKGKKKNPTAQYLVGFHFITITFVSSLLDSFLWTSFFFCMLCIVLMIMIALACNHRHLNFFRVVVRRFLNM